MPVNIYSEECYMTLICCLTLRVAHTAVCVDPAKYLPKPRTTKPKSCADESHYVVS